MYGGEGWSGAEPSISVSCTVLLFLLQCAIQEGSSGERSAYGV